MKKKIVGTEFKEFIEEHIEFKVVDVNKHRYDLEIKLFFNSITPLSMKIMVVKAICILMNQDYYEILHMHQISILMFILKQLKDTFELRT